MTANIDHTFAVLIGDRFAELLRDGTPDAVWENMRRENRDGPEYQGPKASCASHNFCDANMVMLDAWIDTLHCEPAVLDENATVEAHNQASELWGAAWDYAKRAHLTAGADQ